MVPDLLGSVYIVTKDLFMIIQFLIQSINNSLRNLIYFSKFIPNNLSDLPISAAPNMYSSPRDVRDP